MDGDGAITAIEGPRIGIPAAAGTNRRGNIVSNPTKFEAEQAELTQALVSLETEIAKQKSQAVNVDRFLEVVRRYTEIEKLTPAIVLEFIEKIIVHELEQARGDRRQKIEIIYHNFGAVNPQNWQDAGSQN